MKRGPVRPLERAIADQHRHYYRDLEEGTVVPDTVVKKCIHCPKRVVRRKESA